MFQHMTNPFRYPFPAFAISFLMLWVSAYVGAFFRKRQPELQEAVLQDLDVISTATLTLLGLIVGFTFSMAISRYDQRKTYEEEEANAIGTEFVRADVLPAADAAKLRTLLREYLDQRILFYSNRDESELRQIDAATAQLQNQMWATVQVQLSAQPTPALVFAAQGMNDVLNSQGFTQAAWRNQVPIAAWRLMATIAICCNVLVSYSRHRPNAGMIRFLVLPFVLSVAFFAISDIDSPRRGTIRVPPENLISLAQTLHEN
jgi:hypothetical protein